VTVIWQHAVRVCPCSFLREILDHSRKKDYSGLCEPSLRSRSAGLQSCLRSAPLKAGHYELIKIPKPGRGSLKPYFSSTPILK